MPKTRVLIVYGAKSDFSDQLARQLAMALRGDGVEAQAYEADEVPGLEDYDGVVLEGAREGAGWTVFARDFVRRHASELKTLPAWFLPNRRGPSRLNLSEQTWWAHAIARCLGPASGHPTGKLARICCAHGREHGKTFRFRKRRFPKNAPRRSDWRLRGL